VTDTQRIPLRTKYLIQLTRKQFFPELWNSMKMYQEIFCLTNYSNYSLNNSMSPFFNPTFINHNNYTYNNILPNQKRKIPIFLLQNVNNTKYNISNLHEPHDLNDIFNLEDKEEWLAAVNEELLNVAKLNVYETVTEVPANCNIISSKWVFTTKETQMDL